MSVNEPAEWPALRVDEWAGTRYSLHMWSQVVGKVRMACAPFQNHWWHVTLYVSPRGLTTSAFPYRGDTWDIELDLLGHRLVVRGSGGQFASLGLRPCPVAAFYADTMELLADVGLDARIRPVPNEVDPAIPFAEDVEPREYVPDHATAFWRQLLAANWALSEFRSGFTGKVSPVHFFWGSFDLAVTRFSGRDAPPHPGGIPNCPDWVMVESYNRQLSSAGFWPGGGQEGAFYSYAYPEPDGLAGADVLPAQAYWYADGGQFLLPYEHVRTAPAPARAVQDFLRTTYEAAARLGGWPG